MRRNFLACRQNSYSVSSASPRPSPARKPTFSGTPSSSLAIPTSMIKTTTKTVLKSSNLAAGANQDPHPSATDQATSETSNGESGHVGVQRTGRPPPKKMSLYSANQPVRRAVPLPRLLPARADTPPPRSRLPSSSSNLSSSAICSTHSTRHLRPYPRKDPPAILQAGHLRGQ